jgi:hypothetical protein
MKDKEMPRTGILLLELARRVALNKGRLTHATIADKDQLERRNLALLHFVC